MAQGKKVPKKPVPAVKVSQGKITKPRGQNWKVHVLSDVARDLAKVPDYSRAYPLLIDIESVEATKLLIVFRTLGTSGSSVGSGRCIPSPTGLK